MVSSDIHLSVVVTPRLVRQTNLPVPPKALNRFGLVSALKDKSKECDVVLVTGEEGVGKSVLLDQFTSETPTNSISVFCDRLNKISSDFESIVADMTCQLAAYCGIDIDESKEYGVVQFKKFVSRATYKQNKSGTPLFIIIDGINKLSAELTKAVLDILPFGSFKIVISGLDVYKYEIPTKYSRLEFSIPRCSAPDIMAFFSPVEMGLEIAREIERISKGRLDILCSIYRLTTIHGPIDKIMADVKFRHEELFELEWKQIKTSDNGILDALALIAFVDVAISVQDINGFFGPSREVTQNLQSLTFIAQANSSVHYVSATFRAFAQKKLAGEKKRILGQYADWCVTPEKKSDHAEQAASILHDIKDDEKLLGLLGHEEIKQIVTNTKEVSALLRISGMGLAAATRADDPAQQLRFCFQGSMLLSVNVAARLLDEISVYLELGDTDAAILLARAVAIREDRLALLAGIAERLDEKGLSIQSDVQEEMDILVDEVDVERMGQRAYDVASVLMRTNSGLSIRLLRRIQSVETSPVNARPKLTNLAISAVTSKQSESAISGLKSLSLPFLENENRLRRFSMAAKVLLKNLSADDLIKELDSIPDEENTITLAKLWIMANLGKSEAIRVAKYAVGTVIGSSKYTPTARDYAVISRCLLSHPNPSDTEAADIASMLDAQRINVEKVSPTEDCCDFELVVAGYQARINHEECKKRCADIFKRYSMNSDVTTRTVCLAMCFASFTEAKDKEKVEFCKDISAFLNGGMLVHFANLLKSTAEHYIHVRKVIGIIAPISTEMGLCFSMDLNTQDARDGALMLCLETLIDIKGSEIKLQDLIDISENIVSGEGRDEGLVSSINAAIQHFKTGTQAEMEAEAEQICAAIEKIKSIEAKCDSFCSLLKMLKRKNRDEIAAKKVPVIIDRLDKLHELLDSGMVQARVSLAIAECIIPFDRDLGRKYLKGSILFRNSHPVGTDEVVAAYIRGIYLLTTALVPLVEPLGRVAIEDLDRFRAIIEELPSAREQTIAWSDLAMQLYVHGRHIAAVDIAEHQIYPLIQQIKKDNNATLFSIIAEAFPALYLWNQAAALDSISVLSEDHVNSAINSLHRVYFHELSIRERYESDDNGECKITNVKVMNALLYAERATHDYVIYKIISDIADGILGKKDRKNFTGDQRSEITRKLRHIVGSRLPDPKNIKHQGYKLAACAHILSIEYGPTNKNFSEWEDLLKKISTIDNISDRPFVYIICAECLAKTPYQDLSKDVLHGALKEITTLESSLDKVDRLLALVDAAKDIDQQMAKEALKLALVATQRLDIHEQRKRTRTVIDQAFRISETYAAELAKSLDDDPSRLQAKSDSQRQLEDCRHRKASADSLQERDGRIRLDEKRSYETIRYLASALNGGRITAVDPVRLVEVISPALSNGIVPNLYRYMYYTNNYIVYYKNKKGGLDKIRKLFNALADGMDLTTHFANRMQGCSERDRSSILSRTVSDQETIFSAGETDVFVKFLRDWMSESTEQDLILCDPYFTDQELWFVKLCQEVNPEISLSIITSQEGCKSAKGNYEEYFQLGWKRSRI
jgi:hypothetical protein